MTPPTDFSGNTSMSADKTTQAFQLSVIHVTGSDAADFLRAQLTRDLTRLGPGEHTLAAWCDAKGQTQLILRVTAAPEGYYLLLPRDILEPTIKRLRMYVLRADVTLRNLEDTYQVSGLPGNNETPDNGA